MSDTRTVRPLLLVASSTAVVWLSLHAISRSAESGAPLASGPVPPWQIEATYQDSRDTEESFRFRVQRRGKTILQRDWEEDVKEARSSTPRGNPGNAPGGNGDNATSDEAQPGREEWSKDLFSAVRFDYDWSSEDGGPDLLRLHLGDHPWDRPLGLDELLRKAGISGTLQMNGTHDLDTLNLSIGLERPVFGLLDPGPSWAHYLVLGLDMERVSPEAAAQTTHGNATVEAFWSRGWGWTRTVDIKQVRSEAVSAISRGTGIFADVDQALKKIKPLVDKVAIDLRRPPPEQLQDPIGDEEAPALTPEICDTILGAVVEFVPSVIGSVVRVGDTDEEVVIADGEALKKALEAEAQWKKELRLKWFEEQGASAEAIAMLRQRELKVTYWDLLAIAVPAVGQVYDHLMRWSHDPDSYAGAHKDAPDTFLFVLKEKKWWEKYTTVEEPGETLVSDLCGYARRHMGRSVPDWVFRIEAVGWAPIGGGEGYDFHGSMEPKLIWRKDGTSKWGLTASYKYGYERSTRVEKVEEWFAGFNYAFQ